jgi:hypothetical protein
MNSTQRNPLWKSDSVSTRQYFPRLLRYHEFHYSADKSLPPVQILTQLNPYVAFLFIENTKLVYKCFKMCFLNRFTT